MWLRIWSRVASEPLLHFEGILYSMSSNPPGSLWHTCYNSSHPKKGLSLRSQSARVNSLSLTRGSPDLSSCRSDPVSTCQLTGGIARPKIRGHIYFIRNSSPPEPWALRIIVLAKIQCCRRLTPHIHIVTKDWKSQATDIPATQL